MLIKYRNKITKVIFIYHYDTKTNPCFEVSSVKDEIYIRIAINHNFIRQYFTTAKALKGLSQMIGFIVLAEFAANKRHNINNLSAIRNHINDVLAQIPKEL